MLVLILLSFIYNINFVSLKFIDIIITMPILQIYTEAPRSNIATHAMQYVIANKIHKYSMISIVQHDAIAQVNDT